MSNPSLIERLRRKAQVFPAQGGGGMGIDRDGKATITSYITDDGFRLVNPDGPEATDRIQSLEAENKRLREALVALADGADKCAEAPHFIVQPFLAIYKKHGETIAEVRAALAGGKPQKDETR